MNFDSLDLNLPGGPGLPPPPPMDREAFWRYQKRRQQEFYQSPHYEAWLKRTSEEMRHAKAFVWID
jgi:hypothetical protein